MKRSIQILLTLILSALIVYGGSGVNAYFFCCDDCRSEGASVVTDDKCCEIHSHEHANGAHMHLTTELQSVCTFEMHDTCGIERIHFDWQTFTQLHYQLQPFTIDLDHSPFTSTPGNSIFTLDIASQAYGYRQTQKPPDLSKEDYLSLLTTLII